MSNNVCPLPHQEEVPFQCPDESFRETIAFRSSNEGRARRGPDQAQFCLKIGAHLLLFSQGGNGHCGNSGSSLLMNDRVVAGKLPRAIVQPKTWFFRSGLDRLKEIIENQIHATIAIQISYCSSVGIPRQEI